MANQNLEELKRKAEAALAADYETHTSPSGMEFVYKYVSKIECTNIMADYFERMRGLDPDDINRERADDMVDFMNALITNIVVSPKITEHNKDGLIYADVNVKVSQKDIDFLVDSITTYLGFDDKRLRANDKFLENPDGSGDSGTVGNEQEPADAGSP